MASDPRRSGGVEVRLAGSEDIVERFTSPRDAERLAADINRLLAGPRVRGPLSVRRESPRWYVVADRRQGGEPVEWFVFEHDALRHADETNRLLALLKSGLPPMQSKSRGYNPRPGDIVSGYQHPLLGNNWSSEVIAVGGGQVVVGDPRYPVAVDASVLYQNDGRPVRRARKPNAPRRGSAPAPLPGEVVRFVREAEAAWSAIDARYEREEKDPQISPAQERELARHAIAADGSPMSRGKDRLTYDVADLAVKVARHATGLDANLREAELWAKSPATWRRWLVPVVASDPKGRWLVMRIAQPGVDPDWYHRFERWSGGDARPTPTMPPRKMLLQVEHPNDVVDWMTFGGKPVLYDYA